MKIPFGQIDAKTLDFAKKNIARVLASGYLTEGKLTEEFEYQFARLFGWKHAIATSSGTTAGEVVWAAIREITGCGHSLEYSGSDQESPGEVFTPACAFVSTVSCLIAAGLKPKFTDVSLYTLNIDHTIVAKRCLEYIDQEIAIQFVATMGKPTPIGLIATIADEHDLWLIGDFCEAHGSRIGKSEVINGLHFKGPYADSICDAAIYSLYPAHLICGVEGGVICTDNDDIANLCRSIKSHGRPVGSNYFDFQRVGFNAKWSDLHAAVGLASLEGFDERYKKRRWVRGRLIDVLSKFEGEIILYRDGDGEEISPHALPVVLRDEHADVKLLHRFLDSQGVEVKTLFGSLPTQHEAFQFLGHSLGAFPVSERVGRTGLHFSCGDFMEEEHINLVALCFDHFFSKNKK